MKEFFGQNFKTTLHGLAIFAVLAATWFSLIDKETAIWSIGILTASLGITAGDGTNIKKVLIFIPLLFVLSSCTKSNFSAIFKDLGKEVPIQRVTYKIPKPQSDTTIIWYAPYGIFKNVSDFKSDTIDHSEEFNWQGLGDFLWDWNEKRKENKKLKKQNNKQSFHYLPHKNLTDEQSSLYSPRKQIEGFGVRHQDNRPFQQPTEYRKRSCFLSLRIDCLRCHLRESIARSAEGFS